MKRCLLLLSLFSLASYSFSQANDSLERLRDHYSRVGRRETKIGTIMVSGGVVLIVTGAYISYRLPANHAVTNSSFDPNLGNIITLIGGISTLTSIPVFIVAETHKNKAKHLLLTMQKSNALLQSARIASIFQPALTLSLDLSKRKGRD